MNEITIVEVQGQLVVDSRIIAEQLEIQHKNFLETIQRHHATIEANFGGVAFETEAITNTVSGKTNQVVFCYLTEDQSTFLMTLSRNSPKVILCKVGLVKAFSDQKRQLENPIDRTLYNELANRIAKLETTPAPALLPVVPELTRVHQVKELVLNYAKRMGVVNPQPVWQQLYTKFGLLYPKCKLISKEETKLSKVLQIEQAGFIEELYQLALKLFI